MDRPLTRSSRSSAALLIAVAIVVWAVWQLTAVHGHAPAPADEPAAPELAPTLQGHLGGPAAAVAVSGSTAYVAHGPELAAIDLSDPAAPVRIGYIVLPAIIRDLHADGGYIYAALGKSGLRILTFGGGAFTIVGTLGTVDEALTVTAGDGYAYLGLRRSVEPHGLLTVVDARTPSQPTAVHTLFWPDTVRQVILRGDEAYLAAGYHGLQILNIANPAQPVPAGHYATAGVVNGLAVQGDLAFLAEANCLYGCNGGLRVVDLSPPGDPLPVSYTPLTGDVSQVQVAGDVAYVTNRNGRLYLLDIADPARPVLIASYAAASQINKIQLAGATIYAAAGRDGLRLFDVTTASPALIGAYAPPADVRGVTRAGDILYVVDESRLHVVDVAPPEQPASLGQVALPAPGQAVAVSGSIAYVAAGSAGLRLIDVSAPAAMVELGHFDTPGEARDVVVAGQLAYVADRAGGLQIVDVTDPAAPQFAGSLSVIVPVEGVTVSGTHAYLAAAADGLFIADVTDPAAPVQVSQALVPGYARGVVVSGRNAFVAVDRRGLAIVDVADPAQPLLVGTHDRGQPTWNLALPNGQYVYLAEGATGLRAIDARNVSAPVQTDFYGLPGFSWDMVTAPETIAVANGPGGLYLLQHLFRITGLVRQANGLPYAGATVTTDGGQAAVSLETGYRLLNLPAATYTLTPVLADHRFEPAQRTVAVPPDVAGEDFYVLPGPRTVTVTAVAPATLAFDDTQGLETRFDFPAGAVLLPASVTVTPTLQPDAPGLRSAAHAWTLGVAVAGLPQPDFSFAQPVTVTVHYSDADAALVDDEATLRLYRRQADGWRPAAADCAGAPPQQLDLALNRLTAVICQAGDFALFGLRTELYLPAALY